jgi:hypothetical protein
MIMNDDYDVGFERATAEKNENSRQRKEPYLYTNFNEQEAIPSVVQDEIAFNLTERIWAENVANVKKNAPSNLWTNYFVVVQKNCRLAHRLGAPLAITRAMGQHQADARTRLLLAVAPRHRRPKGRKS